MLNFERALIRAGAIVASGLILAASSTVAFAEPVVVTGERADPELPVRVVHFGDLNITTRAGEKRLLNRVSYAVKDVCGFYETSLTVTTAERACSRYAWNGARPQIANALARARNGQMAALSPAIRVIAK